MANPDRRNVLFIQGKPYRLIYGVGFVPIVPKMDIDHVSSPESILELFQEMPMQIGNSDQYLSGIITQNRLYFQVRVTVEDLRSGKKWVDSGIAPEPFESFCKALQQWRGKLTYPQKPSVRTRTLDMSSVALEPYCLRYRQVYEAIGKGKTLTDARIQLWKEYREARKQAGDPIKKGQDIKSTRHNFIDALDKYIEEWQDNKSTDPYEKE